MGVKIVKKQWRWSKKYRLLDGSSSNSSCNRDEKPPYIAVRNPRRLAEQMNAVEKAWQEWLEGLKGNSDSLRFQRPRTRKMR